MNQTPPAPEANPTPPAESASKRGLRREKWQIASVALGISSIFVFGALLQNAIHTVLISAFPSLVYTDWYAVTVQMLPMYFGAMPLSLLLFRIGASDPPERKSLPFPAFLGLLAIGFSLTYAGNLIGYAVTSVLSLLSGNPIQNGLAEMTSSSPFWVNLLFVGILPPIMEEIFYRKLVIDRLRRFGDLPAILISGIAFGLIHGNVNQFFYAATLGCLFALVYLKTGKLRYTILLHMGINLVGGVYSAEMLRRIDLELLKANPLSVFNENIGVLMYLAFFIFLGIAFIGSIVAVIVFSAKYRPSRRRSDHPLSSKEWCRVLLANPGVWMFAFIVILLFLSA